MFDKTGRREGRQMNDHTDKHMDGSRIINSDGTNVVPHESIPNMTNCDKIYRHVFFFTADGATTITATSTSTNPIK